MTKMSAAMALIVLGQAVGDVGSANERRITIGSVDVPIELGVGAQQTAPEWPTVDQAIAASAQQWLREHIWNRLTIDHSLAERLYGMREFSGYYRRELGMSDEAVREELRLEKKLLGELRDRYVRGGHPTTSPATQPSDLDYSRVYRTVEAVQARLDAINLLDPEAALFGEMGQRLWMTVEAAKEIKGGEIAVSDPEMDAVRKNRADRGLPAMTDADLRRSVLIAKSSSLINEYIGKLIRDGTVVFRSDGVREGVLKELAAPSRVGAASGPVRSGAGDPNVPRPEK